MPEVQNEVLSGFCRVGRFAVSSRYCQNALLQASLFSPSTAVTLWICFGGGGKPFREDCLPWHRSKPLFLFLSIATYVSGSLLHRSRRQHDNMVLGLCRRCISLHSQMTHWLPRDLPQGARLSLRRTWSERSSSGGFTFVGGRLSRQLNPKATSTVQRIQASDTTLMPSLRHLCWCVTSRCCRTDNAVLP